MAVTEERANEMGGKKKLSTIRMIKVEKNRLPSYRTIKLSRGGVCKRDTRKKKPAVPRQSCAELIHLAPKCVTRMLYAHIIYNIYIYKYQNIIHIYQHTFYTYVH